MCGVCAVSRALIYLLIFTMLHFLKRKENKKEAFHNGQCPLTVFFLESVQVAADSCDGSVAGKADRVLVAVSPQTDAWPKLLLSLLLLIQGI